MTTPHNDITEHAAQEELLRSREELRRSHALLMAVAEGTPDVIFVKSPEGRYIMANSAAARVAGVPVDQMVGRHDYEVFSAEIVSRLRRHDQAVLSSGEAGTYEEVVEVNGCRRTFLSAKAPYRDPDGRVIGIIGISQDITERKGQEDRLRFLMEASEFLYGPIEGRTTLERLARLTVPYVADWAVVHLVRSDGTLEQTAVAHLDPEKEKLAKELAERYPPDPARRSPILEVIQSGRPLIFSQISPELLRQVAEDDEHLKILESLGLRSALIVPLLRPDAVLGTISFVTSESQRTFGQEDLTLAEELARRAALAIENERLYLELKEVAVAFQKSLLPPALPEIEGVQVAAVYLPAGKSVGGDFYDMFDIGDPGWVIVMGDVCGKGVEAAAITAKVRHTVRAVAMQADSPGRMLAATNEALFPQMDDFRFATMVCAVLSPPVPGSRSRRLTVASGGHPLPLMLRRDGEVEIMGREGTLLGVFPDPTLVDSSVDLEPGDSLLMYTDGALCERSGGQSADRLLQSSLASCKGLSADEIAAKLERQIAVVEDECVPADDTAFLVLQVV